MTKLKKNQNEWRARKGTINITHVGKSVIVVYLYRTYRTILAIQQYTIVNILLYSLSIKRA